MKIELGGAGFILFVVFLVLKLTHTITWSWFWVTLPLWAGLALFAAFFLIVLLIAMVASLFDGRRPKLTFRRRPKITLK